MLDEAGDRYTCTRYLEDSLTRDELAEVLEWAQAGL
jgi:arsenate reductase-like glutaredoxin family protein